MIILNVLVRIVELPDIIPIGRQISVASVVEATTGPEQTEGEA